MSKQNELTEALVPPLEFKRGYLAPEVIEAAIQSQKEWSVPASITLAQFILESDWGTKNLGVFNFFGIKDLKWHPGHVTKKTKEFIHGQWITVEVPFEDFESVADSFSVHGRLLAKSKYYIKAMLVKDDPDAFARALTGVYATDPKYGDKLINIMQKHNLYQYDIPAASRLD